jgi:signal peptidase I
MRPACVRASRCWSVVGYRRLQRSSPATRTYMDVHQRPSHSGMFQQPSPQSTTDTLGDPSTTLWTVRALLAAGIVYTATEYVADITLCEGPSMSPTIRPSGDIILLDKWSPRRYGLQYGSDGGQRAQRARQAQDAFLRKQTVDRDDADHVWHEPRIPVSDLIGKASWREVWRQVTSPLQVGDVVVVHHPSRKGTVCKRVLGLPGDQVLPERVLGSGVRGRLVVVPDGHLWLEGDNPANSADSRSYGPVPAALLVGRVLFRVWPLRSSDTDTNGTLRRGASPRPAIGIPRAVYNSTVLPAGYSGERIVKTLDAMPGRGRESSTGPTSDPKR